MLILLVYGGIKPDMLVLRPEKSTLQPIESLLKGMAF
jgi:hypothetical protein